MIKTFIFLLISFLIEIIILSKYIMYLKKKNSIQFIRAEGPKTHFKKFGTPTGGGLIIIIFTIINHLILKVINNVLFETKDVIILFTILCFSLVGFLDDLTIIKKNNNKGLKGTKKILLEIIFSIIVFILLKVIGYDNTINIKGLTINLSYLGFFFIIFYIIAWSNSFNLTDGLDGLAISLNIVSFLGILFLSLYYKEKTIVLISLSVLVSSLVFLVFNFHPALIFMGNIGSHSLGALIAVCGIILKQEISVALIGSIFIIETISVIIQVVYFKITKGKRVFLMSPYHHHLELKGLSEYAVNGLLVGVSWILLLIGILVGVA